MDQSILNLRRAREAEDDLVSIKKYAEMLEEELANHKAGIKGVAAVRDEVLKELARVDPTHFLLVKENRDQIYDKAYNEEKHDMFGLKALP